MAVRIAENKIKVVAIAFEARFDEGARFLDLCGQAIRRIRSWDSDWKVDQANPQGGGLSNKSKELICVMDMTRFAMSRKDGPPIEKASSDKIVESLASSAATIYPILTDLFEIPNTTRIGARFSFVAFSDSVEDAEKFIARGATSDLLGAIMGLTQSDPFSCQIRFGLEENATGYRRNIQIATVRVGQVEEPLTGFADDPDGKENGVLIDIDTFTRPNTGHFFETEMFIRNCYSRSFRQAHDVFKWLAAKQQGNKS